MPLTASARLGAYEILAPLGAGGMGEVYRAHDTKLDRDVAIKVLPVSLAEDPESRHRFHREAHAAASVSHPNLLAVFDFGTDQDVTYIVTELLEGETLRQRLREGPLLQRKAVEFALQIANGLGAAHDKGIVHRDLKPENVFVTSDGRVKILDFGLARLTHATDAEAATVSIGTRPGQVLGTPGYMSPEQVRGLEADARSDIFSLGTLLYEMISGKPAFHGDSVVEALSATLHDDPPDLTQTGRQVSPALERIVRHCIEKNPAERFQSARDVAFALESAQVGSQTAAGAVPAHSLSRRNVILAAGTALPAGAFFAGMYAARIRTPAEPPVFHRVTYRRGVIREARFTPDGTNIVYGAALDGRNWELFTTRSDSSDSRRLGVEDAQLLAVSSRGELAILVHPKRYLIWSEQGTLATVPLAGGAPRELTEGCSFADWSPEGSEIAVVRRAPPDGTERLEYPRGKPLYSRSGFHFHNLRISPDGNLLAFFEMSDLDVDYGQVVIVERGGKQRVQSGRFPNAIGLAWSADGREVWFTAMSSGGSRALRAVNLSGKERTVLRVPGWLTLKDISRDGRVLLCKESERFGILALSPGSPEEHDLSWYSWSLADDISSDAKRIVFSEGGEAGEDRWGVYIRDMDGGPAARLGDGVFGRLSPNGKWVAAITQYRGDVPTQLVLLPVGAGETRRLTRADAAVLGRWYGWLPDSSGIVYTVSTPNQRRRTYLVQLNSGEPRPATAEGTWGWIVSPDGRHLVARSAGNWVLCPLAGGPEQRIPGIDQNWAVLGWEPDGSRLRVAQPDTEPLNLMLLDYATGERRPWKKLARSVSLDGAGLVSVSLPTFSRDGNAYVYTYHRQLSDLYVVHGLR